MKEKTLSRQRRWQIKMLADGRCTLCGKTRKRYTHRCDDCQTKWQTRQNEKRRLTSMQAKGKKR